MSRPVVIISALLPPLRGGLADHTFRLAELLAARFPIQVISSTGVATDTPFPVRAVMTDWQDTVRLRREIDACAPDSVILWQYVPHMYGRGGANRRLPRLVADLHLAGRQQVLVTHEIAADLNWRPHWLWYALHHRWQWRRLIGLVDAIPVACERWIEEWSERRPDVAQKFFLLPSPTSIAPVAVAADHRAAWRVQQRLPADAKVLLYFGTVNPTKQLGWIESAWRQANERCGPVAFCVVGGQAAFAPGSLGSLFKPLGYLPADEASRALHAADVLALPFFDGVSERRTTLMAGLAHGLAVATTSGHNTGTNLRGADFLALSPAHDEPAFVRNVVDVLADDRCRKGIAEAGLAAYRHAFDWPVVIERLAGCLASLPSANADTQLPSR